MLVTKSIVVESSDWAKLKKISKKKMLSMSWIIREAIHNYIEAQKGV